MRDAAASPTDGAGAVDITSLRNFGRTSKFLTLIFIRYRFASLALAIVAYAAILLVFGESLAVSSNYFVIAPLMAAALGFGTRGGSLAGALALPANLLLFAAIGHPEFSPASKVIAEASGLGVGFAIGRLADYFRGMEAEIRKRIATETALRTALEEKKLLLRELHHRVKNNLSVIKSLVQLQRNRSTDPSFLEAADELIGRIFAIALVHDQLNTDQSLAAVETSAFIEALVSNLSGGLGLEGSRVRLDLDADGRYLQMEAATSLGLIVNEVLTNSLKHASPDCSIVVSLKARADEYRLVITDDGPGPSSARGTEASSGLGMKLVRALARNLGGWAVLETAPATEGCEGSGGARFELSFPSTFMELVATGQASPM